MKRMAVIIMSVFSVSLAMGFAPPAVFADAESAETGRLLAILLDSGRVTIAGVQVLINDETKGDKGFTPEVFEERVVAKFKERSGIDLAKLKTEKAPAQAKQLLPMLVEAGKKVVATYQPILNKQGLAYKNFIPATWGTQAASCSPTMSRSCLRNSSVAINSLS